MFLITGVEFNLVLVFTVDHQMCDFFTFIYDNKEFACQLRRDNCSQFHHILLLTLNLLVCHITEYFHVIFSLGTWLY